jgi:N-carbamoyl-L-amino-acid hydrolase
LPTTAADGHLPHRPAHRACQAPVAALDAECGFDEVALDAVGNVVGVYHGTDPAAPRLLTGSHYDTVRNGGRTTAGWASSCR